MSGWPSGERLALASFVTSALLAVGNGVAIRFSNREPAPLWGAGLRFHWPPAFRWPLWLCSGSSFRAGPLFTTAAAIVSSTGGVLSHAAVVAREYGVPAVPGAPGATTSIRDGQTVEVDGATGIVRVVSGPPQISDPACRRPASPRECAGRCGRSGRATVARWSPCALPSC